MFTQAGINTHFYRIGIWAWVQVVDPKHRFRMGWAQMCRWRDGNVAWVLYGKNEHFLKWGTQLIIRESPGVHVWITGSWSAPRSNLLRHELNLQMERQQQ